MTLQGDNPLQAIAYCSRAASGLTLEDVERLAAAAATFNFAADITSVLLTDGCRFLQYLEGPEQGIKQAYRRIINARSHLDMVELGRSRGHQRRIPHWPMRWLLVEPEDLRIAIVSDWRGLAHRSEVDVFQVPSGMERLIDLVHPHAGFQVPGGRDTCEAPP